MDGSVVFSKFNIRILYQIQILKKSKYSTNLIKDKDIR